MRYLFALIVLAIATPASADLIFFSESRSMSVKSHRVEGDRIVVSLRGGGEMAFDRSVILKITPDEVPYPEEKSSESDAADEEAPLAATAALVERTVYDPIIESASNRHGVSARLVKALIQVESAFQPRARSHKGAMGLMQLMPDTARQYRARPYDPASNIEAGTMHLKKLLEEFDLPEALAAYNAGEAAVRRFGGIPPYSETKAYVARILGLLR